jgi:hypothetical protein
VGVRPPSMRSTISKRGVSHNAWLPYGAQVTLTPL